MPHSQLLVDEIRQRTQWRYGRMQTACDFGVSAASLTHIKEGGSVGTRNAARILAAIREEDLALADKIEDELLASWRDELRRGDQ